MGITKENILPIARVFDAYSIEGPLYALGDQETLFTPKYVLRLLKRKSLLKRTKVPVKPDHINPDLCSAETFFAMLGVDEYHDIDLSGKASLRLDLSKPLPNHLCGVASCVYDGGTCEHIFDIGQVMTNIIMILRRGGIVIHVSPISHFEHGFYNFNPTFFRDFYGENHFEILYERILYSPFFAFFGLMDGLVRWIMPRISKGKFPAPKLFHKAYRLSNFSFPSLRFKPSPRVLAIFTIGSMIALPGWMLYLFVARKRSLESDDSVTYPMQVT